MVQSFYEKASFDQNNGKKKTMFCRFSFLFFVVGLLLKCSVLMYYAHRINNNTYDLLIYVHNVGILVQKRRAVLKKVCNNGSYFLRPSSWDLEFNCKLGLLN